MDRRKFIQGTAAVAAFSAVGISLKEPVFDNAIRLFDDWAPNAAPGLKNYQVWFRKFARVAGAAGGKDPIKMQGIFQEQIDDVISRAEDLGWNYVVTNRSDTDHWSVVEANMMQKTTTSIGRFNVLFLANDLDVMWNMNGRPRAPLRRQFGADMIVGPNSKIFKDRWPLEPLLFKIR